MMYFQKLLTGFPIIIIDLDSFANVREDARSGGFAAIVVSVH